MFAVHGAQPSSQLAVFNAHSRSPRWLHQDCLFAVHQLSACPVRPVRDDDWSGREGGGKGGGGRPDSSDNTSTLPPRGRGVLNWPHMAFVALGWQQQAAAPPGRGGARCYGSGKKEEAGHKNRENSVFPAEIFLGPRNRNERGTSGRTRGAARRGLAWRGVARRGASLGPSNALTPAAACSNNGPGASDQSRETSSARASASAQQTQRAATSEQQAANSRFRLSQLEVVRSYGNSQNQVPLPVPVAVAVRPRKKISQFRRARRR